MKKEIFTYLIQCGENGPIKIGQSIDPSNRLYNMQIYNPEKLTLLKTTKTKEFVLHEFFKEDRLKGEWYKPSEKLLTYIQNNEFPQKKIKKEFCSTFKIDLEKIKCEFKKLGFTQEQFVKQAKTTRQTLHNIKKYQSCRFETLDKIAKTLGVLSTDLIDCKGFTYSNK